MLEGVIEGKKHEEVSTKIDNKSNDDESSQGQQQPAETVVAVAAAAPTSASQSDSGRPSVDNGEGTKACQFQLSQFELVRILSNNSTHKSVALLGHFGDLSREQQAIVTLEKTAFTEGQLQTTTTTGESERNSFFTSKSQLRTEFINDVYGNFQCLTDPEINQLKVTIIYPASEKHIVKFAAQQKFLLEETAADYQTVTLPHLEQEQLSLEGTPYSGSPTQNCPNSSAPNSLPSHLHTSRQSYNFWKASGSQSPLTSASSINSFFRPSVHSRGCFRRTLHQIWRFLKWPLGLLLICSLLGLVVYFLVVDRDIMSSSLLGDGDVYNVEENLSIDFNDFTHTNDLDSGPVTTFGRDHKDNAIGFSKDGATPNSKFSFGLNNDLLAVLVKKTNNGEGQNTFWTSTSTEHESLSEETPAQVVKVLSSTTTAPVRKTSTISLKDYTKGRVQFDEDEVFEVPADEHTTRAIDDVHHHHDLDGGIQRNLTSASSSTTGFTTSTTDSSLYRTKVSPTLPILSRFEITTEGLKRFNISEEGTAPTSQLDSPKPCRREDGGEVSSPRKNPSQLTPCPFLGRLLSGICKSTSLPLCRGVLQYDLTNSSNRRLTNVEYEHFQYLINSKCSVRVAEFVCLILEPECRPTRMGTLAPCKRICKSILEPCAHIIASSEVLTATFDCDVYPDSNDRAVCEDPTRHSKCYANEFQCADSSCIPLQWKCDNIKDCQSGEDESDCKFCERDEYRCMSNDKCIPDKWRCDQYEDCPDASDELDCYYDEPTTYPSAFGSQREYPFVQVQVPNSPVNGKPYLTITNEDRERNLHQQDQQQGQADRPQRHYPDYDSSREDDEYEPTAAENVPQINRRNRTETVESRTARLEDQTEAETTRTISVPKSLSNFQDSKEIMMTSDSENDFRYSSTSRAFLTTAHASPCPEGELRCVSGICISVSQLCDKVTDCPDGADEAMCVYKDETTEQSPSKE